MLLLNSKKGVITFNAPHVGETKHAPHVGETKKMERATCRRRAAVVASTNLGEGVQPGERAWSLQRGER